MDNSIDAERWNQIQGYEGIYEISDLGRVRRSRPGQGTMAGKVLKIRRNKEGYHQVVLYDNGAHSYRTATLVASTFISDRPEGLEVNHIDGDKDNNRADNLEYVTKSENTLHAFRLGLRKPTIGELHGMAKLTLDNVREIRRLFGKMTQVSMARIFGVSTAQISRIKTGKRWGKVQ